MYKFSRFAVSPSAVAVDDSEREARIECAKRSLSRLASAAAEFGAVIAVKNLPKAYLGSSLAEMNELISVDSTFKIYFNGDNVTPEEATDFLADIDKNGVKYF